MAWQLLAVQIPYDEPPSNFQQQQQQQGRHLGTQSSSVRDNNSSSRSQQPDQPQEHKQQEQQQRQALMLEALRLEDDRMRQMAAQEVERCVWDKLRLCCMQVLVCVLQSMPPTWLHWGLSAIYANCTTCLTADIKQIALPVARQQTDVAAAGVAFVAAAASSIG
jgi:hypothetical protein